MAYWIHALRRESRFLRRKPQVLAVVVVALALSIFAVWSGLQESAQTTTTISRLIEADKQDRQAATEKHADFGSLAYYSFHLTYSPLSELAFAAMGDRDVYPWKHRIRMLALEGQIYENDISNPELSQAGRIDFAFVISVLAPLFIILLLHDLKAAETSAGRYDLLVFTSAHPNSIWYSRTFLVCLWLSLALLLPFWVGAFIAKVSVSLILWVTLLTCVYIGFWALLCWWVSTLRASAPRLASILLGGWLVSTFILPVISDEVIEHSINSPAGGDILLLQREVVNDAWDIPHKDTFDAFVAEHPEWKEHTQMNNLFEWKWYFAFQQVGDQKAAELSEAYRQAIKDKYDAAGWVALLSPAAWLQRRFSRLADTDALAALDYDQKVRAFHQSLRLFYYPLQFKATEFDAEILKQRPEFHP